MLKAIAVTVLATISAGVMAENIIRATAPVADRGKSSPVTWAVTGEEPGEWVTGSSSCSGWVPEVDSVEKGVSFTQSGTNCTEQQQREVRAVLTNSVTGATKTGDVLRTEDRSVSGEATTRQAMGTAEPFVRSGVFLGRRVSSDVLFGLYHSVTTNTHLGNKIYNEYGDMVMIYGYKANATTCWFRMTANGPNGWDASLGINVPANATKFLNRYNMITMRDANDNIILQGNFVNLASEPKTTSEGGLVRQVSIPCSTFDAASAKFSEVTKVTAEF